MCACGHGWLPLFLSPLLSTRDRKIPVFTGANGTLTVRRLSLAGVILGLPLPAFLRSPTPLRGGAGGAPGYGTS